MVLHILKTVVVAQELPAYYETFVAKTEAYFRARHGNLGAYLLRDRHNSALFFHLSYWKNPAALRAARQDPQYAATVASAPRLLHERPKAYACHRIRVEPRTYVGVPAGSGIVRATALSVEHARRSEVLACFDAVTDTYSRQQPGCRCVELYEVDDAPDDLWLFSYWDAKADLARYIDTDVMEGVRALVRDAVDERVQSWNLAVADDDARRPLTHP